MGCAVLAGLASGELEPHAPASSPYLPPPPFPPVLPTRSWLDAAVTEASEVVLLSELLRLLRLMPFDAGVLEKSGESDQLCRPTPGVG